MVIICILIIAGSVILDQLTKWLVMLNMELGDVYPVINGILNISYIQNFDIVFGIEVPLAVRWMFIILSVICVIAAMIYLFKIRPREWYYYVPISMIIGGGIGNLIDRFFYGKAIGQGGVVDFIDFCAFPRVWNYVFNVADSFVCVGAFGLMATLIVDIIKEEKAGRAANNKPRQGHDDDE